MLTIRGERNIRQRPLGLVQPNLGSRQAQKLRWWMPLSGGATPADLSSFPVRYFHGRSLLPPGSNSGVGGGSYPTQVIDGIGGFGRALDFQNNGGLIWGTTAGVTTPTTLDGSTARASFSAWVQADAISAYHGVIGSDGLGASLIAGGGTGNALAYLWENTSDEYNANSGLIFDVTGKLWQFVAVAVSPTAATLYMYDDAAGLRSFVNTKTHSAKDSSSIWDFTVGADRATGRYWDGRVTEARIYDRTLTLGDVAAMTDPATRFEMYQQPFARAYQFLGIGAGGSGALAGPLAGSTPLKSLVGGGLA